jgi:hypothetical protein
MWQKVQKLLTTIGQRRRRATSSGKQPDVIVHDPSAAGPRDLDDVFRDEDVQRRVAELIAASKKRD